VSFLRKQEPIATESSCFRNVQVKRSSPREGEAIANDSDASSTDGGSDLIATTIERFGNQDSSDSFAIRSMTVHSISAADARMTSLKAE
jgi:hypothetical protein